MNNHIPIIDLSAEIEMLRSELDDAYHKVLKHGRFIMGPEVAEFEQEVAGYLGVEHAVGVNSGTDALVIALRSAGVKDGDEIITTPFTFFATVESIEMIDAKPVFSDIQEQTFNIDPSKLDELVTGRTRAIIPVHLYGRPADMNLIMKFARTHDIKVIEDCAQSFGASYTQILDPEINDDPDTAIKQTGSIGDAGAFSFFPTKNLGGFGDGGLIATDDDGIAETARKLRAHGSLKKYQNEMMGYNSRLDTLQAALLMVKLRYIDTFNQKRWQAADQYTNELGEVEEIVVPSTDDPGHIFHQYTIRVKDGLRDKLHSFLREQGIDTMIYYPVPCHKLPVYLGKFDDLKLPVTERLSQEVLSLPIGPFLKEKDQERVVDSIKDFFR